MLSLLRGIETTEALRFVLSFAVSAVPEDLPIALTVIFVLGMRRMAKRNALVRSVKAIENLGLITTIATDKTGTLTENRMEVARFEPEAIKGRLLEIGIFSNDAIPDGAGFRGDAVDAALLRAAQGMEIDVQAERRARPILTEFTFDNTRKRMSTVSRRDGRLWAATTAPGKMRSGR